MALSRSVKWFIACALLGIFGLLWGTYFFYELSPAAAGSLSSTAEIEEGRVSQVPTSTVPFVVSKGEGFRDIATKLESHGLIRSASAFKWYTMISRSAHLLKPGLYTLSAASSSIEIARLLVAGPAKEITILIPEGYTLREIDETLARYGVIRAGSLARLKPADLAEGFPFLEKAPSLEGFLFPDTYRFYFDSTGERVAEIMLATFAAKVNPLITEGDVANYDSIPVVRRGIFSLYDVVTVASMIESEVPHSADRRLVADIMYRRFKIGMPLQIDATRDYARIVGDDRYDTYAHVGLPRGPISSPGLDAIQAALAPQSSSYLYYLSDPKTDKTIFAKTFDEHKANGERYLY